MWHSYIFRKCCKFWHHTPLSCQKRCSKIQKIWHLNEAPYGQQISSHMRDTSLTYAGHSFLPLLFSFASESCTEERTRDRWWRILKSIDDNCYSDISRLNSILPKKTYLIHRACFLSIARYELCSYFGSMYEISLYYDTWEIHIVAISWSLMKIPPNCYIPDYWQFELINISI